MYLFNYKYTQSAEISLGFLKQIQEPVIDAKDEYMTWGDQHGISYIPWAWGTQNEFGNLGLLSSIEGKPSAYGETFYVHFRTINPVGSIIASSPLPTLSNITDGDTPTPSLGCYFQPGSQRILNRIKFSLLHFLCNIGFYSFCQNPVSLCSNQQNTNPVSKIPVQSLINTCQQLGGFCSERVENGMYCRQGRHLIHTGICPQNFHCCISD